MKRTLSFVLVLVLLTSMLLPAVSALPESFSMNKLSGGTFTEKDLVGHITVIIFGQLNDQQTCFNTNHVIDSYVGDFSGRDVINVVVADITSSSKSDVEKYANAYNCEDFLTVCYGGACNTLMWNMIRTYDGGMTSITTPYTVIFDRNGNYAGSTFGLDYGTQLDILASLDSSIEPSAECYLTFGGKCGYKDAHSVVEIVNKERAKDGKTALTEDEDLTECAMLRAAECAVLYSHTRPDGESGLSVLPSTYYRRGCGENIAYSFAGKLSTPENTMNGWMNSPGHRENILDADYSSIGVGCVEVNGVVYWTQVFSVSDSRYPVKTVQNDRDDVFSILANTGNVNLFADTHGNDGYLQVGKSMTLDLCHKNTFTGGTVPLYPYSYDTETTSGCVSVSGNTVTGRSAGSASVKLYLMQTDYEKEAAGVKVNIRVGKEEKPARSVGDLNGDGKVNTLDSAYMKMVILGSAGGSDYSDYADINGDGKINTVDSLLLVMLILGEL